MGLNGDVFSEDEGCGGMFGVVTERLTFLRAIDPTEVDTLSALL